MLSLLVFYTGRVCLCSLMGRARVITYGGQELVNALISHYDLEGNIGKYRLEEFPCSCVNVCVRVCIPTGFIFIKN